MVHLSPSLALSKNSEISDCLPPRQQTTMAPLDDFDSECWFLDDDSSPILHQKSTTTATSATQAPTAPMKNRFKEFIKTCLDHSCIKYCYEGSPVMDDDETHVTKSLSPLPQLNTMELHPTAQDVQEFATRGGFYDGTFIWGVEDMLDDFDLSSISFEDERQELGPSPIVESIHNVSPSTRKQRSKKSHREDESWWSCLILPGGPKLTHPTTPSDRGLPRWR